MEITYTLSEIDDVAKRLLSTTKSNVILFYGAMGAGKTTLIKALCKKLDISDKVSSPTYSLVNEYALTPGGKLFHFDFFRIEQEQEVLDIGFDQYLDDGAWIFIEWPERIKNFVPKTVQKVHLRRLESNRHHLKIH